jgi:hypothetical protein
MLSEADVVHVKGLSVDGVTGLSAVSQAARVLGLSDSLVKPAMSFFESRNPRPAGVLRLGTPEMHPSREGLEREIDGLQKDLKDAGFWCSKATRDTRTSPTGSTIPSLSSRDSSAPIRMELNAGYAVERITAGLRIL